jgi:Uma2 family endonuclease
MATAERAVAEQRIVMHGINWQTYQSLLADRGDCPVPRICYDRGELELMSPSNEHEQYRRLLSRMIDDWTVENRIPIRSAGSTTFKREARQKGVEPDECFYVRNERLVRGRRGLDLDVDPPPDLAIEIDISSSSINKLNIYAGLAVPEVWLFTGEALAIYELQSDGSYQAVEESTNLPGFPVKDVVDWIARAETTDETSWARAFQSWVRERGEGATQ